MGLGSSRFPSFAYWREVVACDRRASCSLWVSSSSLGGLAFVALPAESRDRLATLAGARTDFSASYRLGVWRDALRATASSPLIGFGLGTFAEALPPFKRSAGELDIEHAENDYIEVLAEGGLLGFLLVSGGIVTFGASVTRGLRSQGDRLLRGIGVGALAGLVALAVHSAGDFNLRIPSNAFLAACLATLALAASVRRVSPDACG